MASLHYINVITRVINR